MFVSEIKAFCSTYNWFSGQLRKKCHVQLLDNAATQEIGEQMFCQMTL